MTASEANVHSIVAGGTPIAHPLYKEVKLRLTRGLMSGQWRPGEAIPSESRLAAMYEVSLGTVRKAIDELVAEKILVRQQGRGTFVAAHTEDRNLYYFFHIVGQDGRKENPVSSMLSFAAGRATADEASTLGIARNDAVLRVRNLLRLSDRPVVVDDIVIAAARFPAMDAAVFGDRSGTIYGLYQERYGISVIRIAERLAACVADADASRLLEVPAGSPLLRIARVAYTYHDIPVELRLSLVNTADHEYVNDLVRS